MAAAAAAVSIRCEAQNQKLVSSKKDLSSTSTSRSSLRLPDLSTTTGQENSRKILLQPRLCTLRSYADQSAAGKGYWMMKNHKSGTPFFESLSAYIDNSRKTEIVEILSGRLAMVAFVSAVGVEMVTGNSLFHKTDVQGIVEAGGVCAGAVLCAGIFAYLSTARRRINEILSFGYNNFVDSLVDNLVDGLFYEDEFQADWMDDM